MSIESLYKDVVERWDVAAKQLGADPQLAVNNGWAGLVIDDWRKLLQSVRPAIDKLGSDKKQTATSRALVSVVDTRLTRLRQTLDLFNSGQHNQLQGVREQILDLYRISSIAMAAKKDGLAGAKEISGQALAILQEASQASEEIRVAAESVVALEEARAELEAAMQNVVKQRDAVAATLEKANVDAALAGESRARVEEIVKQIASHEETARTLNQKLTAHEAEMSSQREEMNRMMSKIAEDKKIIENLLPSAASAALSSAFGVRARETERTRNIWGAVFIVAIAVLAYFGFSNAGEWKSLALEDIGKEVLRTLPFLAPTVWIAWFSSRQYGHSMRLEEDYAFKAAVSHAFEGYKKQMADIDAGLVRALSEKAIEVFSMNPLRVLDRKLEEMPASEVIERLQEILGSAGKLVDTIGKKSE